MLKFVSKVNPHILNKDFMKIIFPKVVIHQLLLRFSSNYNKDSLQITN
jgi:hypothetical protein